LLLFNQQELRVDALVDSGCTQRNFISPSVANWLRSVGALRAATSGRVCTAFGQCKDLVDSFCAFDVSFRDNVTNKDATITIDATVLDMKNLQLVLGLPTLLQNNLFVRMLQPSAVPSPVLSSDGGEMPLVLSSDGGEMPFDSVAKDIPKKRRKKRKAKELSEAAVTGNEDAVVAGLISYKAPETSGGYHAPVITKSDDEGCALCALRVHKSALLDPEPDAEEIDAPHSLDLQDLLPEGNLDPQSDDELPGPDAVHGPESLQRELKALCAEFRDILKKIRSLISYRKLLH